MYCFHDPASVEARVYNFVHLALQKLEAKKQQIAGKDEEGKYQVSCALVVRDASMPCAQHGRLPMPV